MNVLKSLAFAPISVISATSLQAACIDRGYSSFDEYAYIVELCENGICAPAAQNRSCGNVNYSSQSYEIGSETWLFRIGSKDYEARRVEEFAIEVRPSDPNEIPLTIVDGRSVRLLVGAPIRQARARQISCIPVSDTDACDFINAVLLGLN